MNELWQWHLKQENSEIIKNDARAIKTSFSFKQETIKNHNDEHGELFAKLLL